MNVVACPTCSQQLQYHPQQAGQQVQCPACQASMILPATPVPGPPTDPLTGLPMQMTPQQPGLHNRPSSQSSPRRRSGRQKPKSEMMADVLSDPEIYKKIFGSKAFIIGSTSLLGIVVVIVIINVSIGMAEKAARALPSDIPIPEFLKPDPDPPADVMLGLGLVVDDGDDYAVFKLTDKRKGEAGVFRWYSEQLAEREWVYLDEPGLWKYWRNENRKLGMVVLANDRVVILHDPDHQWNEGQLREAVVLKPDEQKLKSLITAVHNHHDVHKRFPFDKHVAGQDANSGFSWVVYVLPYLKKGELYEKFDMKGDYKSPQNVDLGNERLEVLNLNSGQIKWVRPTSRIPVTFGSILDGSSNTVCFVQSRNIDNSPWTKPTSIKPAEVIAEFKSLKDGESMLFAMYDGSVRRLTNEVELADIVAMLEPDDAKTPQKLFR